MADLVVIVPSRGRPEAVEPLILAFQSTCTADTKLVFAVDDDDPRESDYWTATKPIWPGILPAGSRSMVESLNQAATKLTTPGDHHKFGGRPWRAPFAVGFMGDDHLPRTHGWDQAYLDALLELGTGIVYGDDLLQRRNLPTQCAMTADIVRALGYMAPPALTHLYVDDFWRDLGLAAECLRYLPDVVVEHRHPLAGKAEWDEGYKRVNDAGMYSADAEAYGLYRRERFEADVAKVRALRG
ncbi:MAG TPA: hypothetical protein VFR23_08620 [Jiangellaceae bacterium]|nr:hypothetical protein [Jiangellaceae bacterium]